MDAWKTPRAVYLKNVEQCAQLVDSPLFRPPSGHFTFLILKTLKQDYKIVLWDVLSGDFDSTISSEQCWQNVRRSAQNGSIIVLHDSWKAERHLRYVLPKILLHFSQLGFRFEAF